MSLHLWNIYVPKMTVLQKKSKQTGRRTARTIYGRWRWTCCTNRKASRMPVVIKFILWPSLNNCLLKGNIHDFTSVSLAWGGQRGLSVNLYSSLLMLLRYRYVKLIRFYKMGEHTCTYCRLLYWSRAGVLKISHKRTTRPLTAHDWC